MSLLPRGRFNPADPFPEGGVVTPNVFPSPMQGPNGRLDLHDVIEGELPAVTPNRGWLRIAFGNNPDIDYTSPHLSQAELKDRLGNYRKTLDIDLLVEAARKIKRVRATMNTAALEVPKFGGQRLELPEDYELMKIATVEQAIAFNGVADVDGSETPVSGIHFASGEQNGWVLLGETGQ